MKKRQSDGEGEFYDGIRFQWENEVKHFITGRYLLKCKQRLGISKVKLCVCGEGNRSVRHLHLFGCESGSVCVCVCV